VLGLSWSERVFVSTLLSGCYPHDVCVLQVEGVGGNSVLPPSGTLRKRFFFSTRPLPAALATSVLFWTTRKRGEYPSCPEDATGIRVMLCVCAGGYQFEIMVCLFFPRARGVELELGIHYKGKITLLGTTELHYTSSDSKQ
jgi:hypothetical protein